MLLKFFSKCVWKRKRKEEKKFLQVFGNIEIFKKLLEISDIDTQSFLIYNVKKLDGGILQFICF